AAGRERSGLDGEEAHADRTALGGRGGQPQHLCRGPRGEHSLEDGSTIDGHWHFSHWIGFVWLLSVMAGLARAIHAFPPEGKTWMPGTPARSRASATGYGRA